jgi:hypothetical protein
MEWHHQRSLHKKQFKVQASARKVIMVSIFWVQERMLLEEFLEVLNQF